MSVELYYSNDILKWCLISIWVVAVCHFVHLIGLLIYFFG